MLTEEVMIDHRVHPRLIGTRGRAIRKIMDDYKVDIRFPNRASDNPDVVMVTGAEEDVLDCKEHLLNLEEEFVSNDRRLTKLNKIAIQGIPQSPLPVTCPFSKCSPPLRDTCLFCS